MLKTIEWTDAGVRMIDQTRLPAEEIYVTCTSYQEVADAIRRMVIRGAPAIGVAAAMGIALGAKQSRASTLAEFEKEFERICDTIAQTRPTAQNLFWAIRRMRERFSALATAGAALEQIRQELVEEAQRVWLEDIATNKAMGSQGAALMPDRGSVLTHCNTGALATAGFGTALGVIRTAVSQGKQIHVYTPETRPFLQGSRLTAWELKYDGIPLTLITDNMVGSFMRSGKISCVVLGADRIAANGDVANKIGTYTLAVLAKEHRVPFYVVAPVSTLDLSLPTGDEIPIEERAASEVTHIGGVAIAPEDVEVANPAFDVTPARYITAIITERGVARPPFETSLRALVEKPAPLSAT